MQSPTPNFGSAALARDLDLDVYDYSCVEDAKDRAALEALEIKICRTKPFVPASWEDVCLMCKYQFLELARRDPLVLKALKERMIDTTQHWRSVTDMIRFRFFGCEKRVDEEGKLFTEKMSGQQFACEAFAVVAC